MNWIALLAISATSAFAQTGSTYSEWAQIWFPSGGPSAAPDADPDGDSIPNITEFAFGLTPDAANTAPLFNLSLQGASSERLGFQYYLRTSASNVLVIPQATENLVTGAWRADQFTISSYEYPYPSDITSVGAVDSPSGIPSKRFIRLLVAMDSDGDGISDDWEVAHGLLPFDESDKGADLDGDGDSSWLEFLQGTDPQDANSNSGQFRIPRAPRDVRIQGVSTLTVGWDDVSDNETGFRIYDAAGVLIGTVPADAREFELPATFVFGESVSVTAANAFGESGPTTSFTEPGGGSPRDPIDGGLEISDYDAYSRATAPKIDIKRTTAQTVVVDWRCASLSHLTNTGKKIRIMRQRQGDEWQNIFEAPFEGNETGHHDDNAPAGTTYKYSAMIVMNGPFGLQGSDAAYPAVDDYVESLYGMRMNRSYTASGEMTAPGNNMTAAEPKDRDWFYLKANRAGKGLPSFIPEGGPELENFTTDIDANRGWRYFEAGGVSDTVLAFKGFVVRGRPFTIGAKATVKTGGITSGITMRLDSSPERQGTPTPGLVSTSKEIAEYRLDDREIENPTVRMTGDETAGFDPVTFFASQTLQGGGGFDSKRSVYFKPSVPTNTNFTYTTTGPFTHEVITQEEVELTSDSGGEGEGLLKLPLGDAEGRQVKVQVLPPKGRTIELRKVIYVDDSDPQNITTYEGTEPPAAADLEVSLNDIFKKQAGVQITVVRGVDIIVLSSQLPLQYSAATPTNPRKPIFLTTPAVQQHLWGPYNPDFPPLDPELVLYFVPGLASNTSGLAFGIPSRAALIGPSSGRYSVAKICAHEMGHCFGLSHVWLNQDAGNVSLPQLPDKGGTRLLSYGDGLILRYREAKIVNEWQPGTTTQPGN